MANSDTKMTAVLDQKHYIEELNRHLSCTVTDLQAKMDSLEKTNGKLVEEVRIFNLNLQGCILLGHQSNAVWCDIGVSVQLTAATDRINSLREEREQLQEENTNILQNSQRKEEVKSRCFHICFSLATFCWKSRLNTTLLKNHTPGCSSSLWFSEINARSVWECFVGIVFELNEDEISLISQLFLQDWMKSKWKRLLRSYLCLRYFSWENKTEVAEMSPLEF